MNSPNGGPMIGATSAGQVSVAIALINWSFGVVLNTTRRPTGTIMAPPMSCTTRNSTNCVADSARPHSNYEKVNIANATLKTVLAPKCSATQPLAGISAASVNR